MVDYCIVHFDFTICGIDRVRVFKQTVPLFSACMLLASHLSADPLGYFPQAVPDGIYGGVSFPAGAVSWLGDAVLTADSTLYAVRKSNGRLAVSTLAMYSQKVRAFPADIDGDGARDLIVAFSESSALRLLIRRGEGDSVAVDLATTGGPVLAAGMARIDPDSLPDLVVADSSRIFIFRRIPPDSSTGIQYSKYAELGLSTPAAGHPLAEMFFLFGDFDGNRRTDFVINGYLYFNQSRDYILTRQLPVPSGTNVKLHGFTADADGDGKQEIFWTFTPPAASSSSLAIGDYNSDEIFRAGSVLPTGLQSVTSMFRYDSDGDGNMELGLYSSSGAQAVEFAGTATGIDHSGPRELFSTGSVKGTFIGPAGPDSSGAVAWLFHNAASDSIYAGYVLRPYTNATIDAGLQDSLAGQAVAVGDYNGDNLPDIYMLNYRGSNRLYRGEPGGRFTEVAQQAGVASGNDGISCAWGDFNNDGCQDLFIAGLSLPDKLYFNLGDGAFADSSSLLRYSRNSQRATSASWGDINGDGWLDLLITNFDGPNWLLINRNGRYFDNASDALGPSDTPYRTENATLVDVDLDGHQDIVLLNDSGPTRLLMGTPGGTWTDATSTSGLNPGEEYSRFGQSQSWGDFNGDGYPDLYITRAADIDMMFLNNGPGASPQFSLSYSGNTGGRRYGRMASAIEDLDSDGYTDLLITRSSQYGSNYEIPTNQVYLGDSRGYPSLVPGSLPPDHGAGETLVAPLKFKRSTSLPVAGDLDRDGDIDLLYVNYLPDNPSDLFRGSALPLVYMRNNSARVSTFTVILRRADNRNLAGTSIRLSHSGRTYWKAVSGGGGRIQSGPFLTFSLGDAPFADSMQVRWPDGVSQTLHGPFYPGTFELEVDHTAPKLQLLRWPGGGEQGEPVPASAEPLIGTLGIEENSGLASLLRIVRAPSTGLEDTLRLAFQPGQEQIDLPVPSPLPGDSLEFYIVATDTYGNSTRLPAGQRTYYKLVSEEGALPGDLNGDMLVDQGDLTRIIQIFTNTAAPTAYELSAGDFNHNGKIDVFDIIELLKRL